MQTLIIESSVRATLIAMAVAVVLWGMRIKMASVLHAVWASVVVLMLLLPAWVAWGPRAALPVLPPTARETAVAMPAVSTTIPAPMATHPAPLAPEQFAWDWSTFLFGVYLVGVFALLARLAVGTVRSNCLKSASCVVPVTVGLLHPRIILPESSRDWPQEQLDAVLAHEGEHARRRDPLFQWLALLNRALFWFHPLAWWLERRLSGLAEEACDAVVLSRGHDPRDYSEYLLDLARSVERARTRVNAVGMAMPGIGLNHRIRKILNGVPAPRISRPRMACTVTVCAVVMVILAAGTLVHAQSDATKGAIFEVASVKLSASGTGGGDGKSKQGGGGLRPGLDHGRLNYTASLFNLIVKAYGIKGCGAAAILGESDCDLISGGPDWLKKARFELQAKMPEGSPDYNFGEFLSGDAPQLQAMLRALLADRFKLTIHREKRQIAVYALTVGKKGPKLKTAAEPKIIKRPDDTLIKDRSMLLTFAREPNGEYSGGMMRVVVKDRSISDVTENLLGDVMGRPVLDRTGLKGEFDFTIEYERDPDAPADSLASGGPALITALREELGLKLEATKATLQVLVIDHAELPSTN